MFVTTALAMVLAATGKLPPQVVEKEFEVGTAGQILLLQMSSSFRTKAALSFSESPHTSVAYLQSVANASEEPLRFVQSRQTEDVMPSSNDAVWGRLKSAILEDNEQTKLRILKDLKNGDLEKTVLPPTHSEEVLFSENASEHAATGCGVLWYYHIGKCAGTSVLQWMLQLKGIGGLQEVFDLSGDLGAAFNEFHHQQLQPLVSSMTRDKVVAVHHHHNGPGLYGMDPYFSNLEEQLNAKGCALVRFTLLRQPQPRLMSHVTYNMQFMYAHSSEIDSATYDEFFRAALSQAGTNDFENQYDNTQVRYTLNNWGFSMPFGLQTFPMPFGTSNADALDAVIRILDGFEVVGLVEEVDKSISRVTDLLGLPSLRLDHDNARRQGFQKLDARPLPDDVKGLMEERTRLETKLYEYYASRSLSTTLSAAVSSS